MIARRGWRRVALGVCWTLAMHGALSAQQTVAIGSASHRDARILDELLARPVTINVTKVSLKHAIDTLAASAKVMMQYDANRVRMYSAPVTVHLTRVSLRVALDRVLSGTAFTVIADGPTRLSIIEDTPDALNAMAGTVAGVVSNAKTKRPVSGVTVWLDDSTRVVRTDEQGRYRFVNVAAGTHRLIVRAVGYARQTRVVTVADDQTATIDLALDASVNTLDQVVVTATGEQRIRELGHVVAQINADSLVKAAPIADMGELLQSRIPGLQVLTGSGGMAGGNISIRLRGTSTFKLDPEPIVIVDGIRYKSNNAIIDGGPVVDDARGNGSMLHSPLNDLNPNDIESVEVVKGPSASTLYGPDAANGVLVITTKRGHVGPTKFQWYARPVSNNVPQSRIDGGYIIWSHDSLGHPFQGNCTVIYQYQYHLCTLDSITRSKPTVARDPYSIIAKNRPTWQYGANVSGGVSALQYFLSGNYNSQVGVLQVPPAVQAYLEKKLGVAALSDAIRNPNTLQAIATHGAVSADLSSRGGVSLSSDYTQTNHRTLQTGIFAQQIAIGVPPPYVDTTNINNFFRNPGYSLQNTEDNSTHSLNAINGTTRLTPWMSVTAAIGLDLTQSTTHAILPSGEVSPTDGGFAQDDRRDQVNRTATVNGVATAHPGIFSFRTSLGAQYTYSHLDGITTRGTGLAPGSTSISTLQNVSAWQLWNESVSLGTYGEEVLGLRDRLFLTGALRLDGSTSFGEDYHPRPYPKVGLSWIASDEPLFQKLPGAGSVVREVRFRASYGAASRYPTSLMRLGRSQGSTRDLEGKSRTIFAVGELANPLLRPERSRESEFGADITAWHNIVVGLTWNHRKTNDQILDLSFFDIPNSWVNAGDLTAHGFEATAAIPIIDRGTNRLDLNLAYSYHTDKVLSLGALGDDRGFAGGGFSLGYPMGAVFAKRILGIVDTVGGHADHIIFENEVIRDTANSLVGVVNPPRTLTATPVLSLLNGFVRLSALFDRETGFVRYDEATERCPSSARCLAPFLTTTSEIWQARYAVRSGDLFIVPGDFTRWRELNIAVQIPQRFLRLDPMHLRFTSATVSLQGRNLALWTAYNGPDPESRTNFTNAYAGGIPQARAWSFRFDVTP